MRLLTVSLPNAGGGKTVLQPFSRAGFTLSQARWQDWKSIELGAQEVLVLLAGDRWDEAFRRVEKVPEELRSSLVLVGRRRKERRILARTIQLGVLASVALPVPEWFPPLLVDALPRRSRSYRLDLINAIERLKQGSDEEPPESLIERTATLAGELLGADLAVAVIQTAEPHHYEVITRRKDGGIALERWLDNPERKCAPLDLSKVVFQRNTMHVWPCVSHWREASVDNSGHYAAALIQPIRVPDEESRPGRRSLMTSLNLYWERPYLPVPGELGAFTAIAAVAHASAWRLLERSRRATIHDVSRHVLTHNLDRTWPAEAGAGEGRLGQRATGGERPEDLILALVRAYSGWAGFRAVFVQYVATWNTPWTRHWLAYPEENSVGLAERLRNQVCADGPPQKLRDGHWALRILLASEQPHHGELLAVFRDSSAARAAEADLRRLAEDLQYLIRSERQAADAAAVRYRSTVPIKPEQAEADLGHALELIRQRTDSDGAKVFAILSQADGPKIWQLWNTDVTAEAPEPRPIETDRGLADWVVQHNDWLLIPRRNPEQAAGAVEERCLTAGHEVVFVRARPEREHLPTHPKPDQEHTMLFVPMTAQGDVAGVLAIWRNRQEPFDPSQDPGRLLDFAPQIAAACLRIFQLRKAREELDAIAGLTRALNKARCFQAAYSEIARGAGLLANAAGAVLLLRDEPTGLLYLGDAWFAASERVASSRNALKRFYFRPRIGAVDGELRKTLPSRLSGFEVRSVIKATDTEADPLQTTRTGAGSRDDTPIAVVLLDVVSQGPRGPFPADQLLDQFAESYVQAAWASLRDFSRSLGGRLIDEIGGSTRGEPMTPEEVLAQAADLLHVATGAEAVLTYTGTPRNMQVKTTSPRMDLTRFPSTPSLHSARSAAEWQPLRILDLRVDGRKVRKTSVEALANALGWNALGSWLCCPVVHTQRCIGLVELFTSADGAFLGQDHLLLGQEVVARTASEMHRASVAQQVKELLQLTSELTQYYGAELAEQIVNRLQEWLRGALNRPRCQVAVVAFTPRERQLLLSAATTPGQDLRALERFSMNPLHPDTTDKLALTSSIRTDIRLLRQPQGVLVPISLPGGERLAGHIFALDDERFYADDLETLERVAHYVAFVLDSERERSMARQAMGRFRHALLGPVQGLTSAARFLLRKAAQNLPPADIAKVRDLILAESEFIRLWRENQRFYLTNEIRLRRRRFALRSMVERCSERYRSVAAERDIDIKVDFQSRGELQVDADEAAIDLALSNLLDNACKYSFAHQVITVGASVDGHVVSLWVEDVGHAITKAVWDAIYESGSRGIEHDPFRLILGQGLGLAMARLAARAHDGDLRHTATRAYEGKSAETSGYRVRFTLELPWTIIR